MSALRVLWHVEGWLLFFAPLITLVFAINRGNLLRRINYHTITASFVTASLFVFGFLTDSLDDVVNFQLVEGDQDLIARMGVSLIFLVAGVVTITYQLGEDTLDALYHVFMVLSAQITWFLAAKSANYLVPGRQVGGPCALLELPGHQHNHPPSGPSNHGIKESRVRQPFLREHLATHLHSLRFCFLPLHITGPLVP